MKSSINESYHIHWTEEMNIPLKVIILTETTAILSSISCHTGKAMDVIPTVLINCQINR